MSPSGYEAGTAGIRPEDHHLGSRTAPLVLIEYGDFQCPTCRQAAPAVDLLRDASGMRLLFVFRHYPLEQIHPDALGAAEAAEAAAAQGRFWEMHRLLFANQQHLRMPDLERYAASLDLDMARFTGDMRSGVHRPRIRGDVVLGQQALVRSTPAFFLNGRVQDVSFGMRALHDAVEMALRSPEFQ